MSVLRQKQEPFVQSRKPSRVPTLCLLHPILAFAFFAASSCGFRNKAQMTLPSPQVTRPVAPGQPLKNDDAKPTIPDHPPITEEPPPPMPPHLPNFPPQVQEGIALYAANCAICHGTSIETSAKRNRSAPEITAALQNQAAMKSIKTLDAPKIAAIAAALSFDFSSVPPGPAQPKDSGPMLSTRFGIASALRNLFWDGRAASEPAIKSFGENPFSSRPGIFGFPCVRYDAENGVCPTPDSSLTASLNQEFPIFFSQIDDLLLENMGTIDFSFIPRLQT